MRKEQRFNHLLSRPSEKHRDVQEEDINPFMFLRLLSHETMLWTSGVETARECILDRKLLNEQAWGGQITVMYEMQKEETGGGEKIRCI